MPSHVSRRSWAGPKWEEFDPWYYGKKHGELAGGFKYIPPKTNMEPENIQILEKDGQGETSTKQLFFGGSMCQLSRVSFLFSPPKFGEIFQFHEDGFYKWVESQPPTIAKILLEIRMRFFGPTFFQRSIDYIRSSKTPKRRTRRIP